MRSADRVGIPHARVFLLEGRQDSQTTLQDCIDIGRSYGPGGQEGSFKILDGSSNRDSCGYLNFSSGTTGRPKGVSFKLLHLSSCVSIIPANIEWQAMLSHHNIIAQCMQAGQTSDIENKKMLAVLPLYHGRTVSPLDVCWVLADKLDYKS